MRHWAAVEITHGISSCDTFYGNGNENAVSRHADEQFFFCAGEQFLYRLLRRKREHNTLFVGCNSEQLQHALHRSAAHVQDHGKRSADCIIYRAEPLRGSGIDNENNVIRAASSSQSSTISKAPTALPSSCFFARTLAAKPIA